MIRIFTVVVLLLCVSWFAAPTAPALDDAYIPVHAAHVLLDGHDQRFGVPALTGATSPPYVAALTALIALGASDLTAIRILSALSLAAFVAAAWMLAGESGVGGWRSAAVVALGLLAGNTWLQVTNGLETGFATALVLAAIAFALRRSAVGVALAAGLLPWLRPDLALVAIAVWSWTLWQQPERWRPLVVLPLLIAVPVALWVWMDTGAIIPNTISAKRAFFAEHCLPLVSQIGRVASILAGWALLLLPLAVPGAIAALRTPMGRVGLVAVVWTLAIYTAVLPGATAHNDHRYLYPMLLPWCIYGVATTIGRVRGSWVIVFAAALLIASPLQLATFRRWSAARVELLAMSRWVAQNVPAGATVAVHDAGAISIVGKQALVDLVGLKSPQSLLAHAHLTLPSCGRDRPEALATIMRATHPTYLVVVSDWERLFNVSAGAVAAGMVPAPVRASLNGYTIYRLDPRARTTNASRFSTPVERPAAFLTKIAGR